MNAAPLPPSEIRHLKALSRDLEIWAFTDFERARQALEDFEELLPDIRSSEILLTYHRHSAFLRNQLNQYERALEHARWVIGQLSRGGASASGMIEAWADLAAIHLNRRDWPAAQDALDEARRLVNQHTPDTLKALVSCRESFFHLHLGNATQALAGFQDAECKLMDLPEDAPLRFFYLKTLILSGLGEIHERLGNKESSLNAYRSVLPIVERHRLRPRRAWLYINAGRAAMASDDPSEARFLFEQGLKFASESDSDARTLALGNLGILAFLAGNDHHAHDLFNQAANQYLNPVKESDFTNLSKIETWRAGLLINLGDLTGAKESFEKAYDHGERGFDRQHQAQICLNLAAVFAQEKNFEKAYHWQLRATDINDEYFQTVRNRERQELEVRHQLERSRQEAQVARLRVATLQLKALRAQMNPHFLFNSLNAIQGLINSGRNNEADDYLAKFAKMMRTTLEYSDLEEVTLEQEIEFLSRYLEINKKLRFRDKLQYNLIAPSNIDPDWVQVPTMILQPFVENAIEHGLRPLQQGDLFLGFYLNADKKTILCTIEDNGIGYNRSRARQSEAPEYQQHRSRGMDITRERLLLLHQLQQTGSAEPFIRIIDLAERTSGQKSGTRVEVTLPVLRMKKA